MPAGGRALVITGSGAIELGDERLNRWRRVYLGEITPLGHGVGGTDRPTLHSDTDVRPEALEQQHRDRAGVTPPTLALDTLYSEDLRYI